MRILTVHNYYMQAGGEDSVFRLEADLLRQHGHAVIEYLEDNRRIRTMNSASVAMQAVWSQESYKKVAQVIERERPDIAHFHNIFPLISPSAYYACQARGVPVVQSLDNQRLICPAASFYREGRLCLDCLGKTPPWPGVLHACYHDSRIHTAVVSAMITIHRWLKTWQNSVDIYIASTEFYRDIFVRSGLPSEKLTVKPHFVPEDPGLVLPKPIGEYALFVGRLDPEKGINTLLEAWAGLDIPLKIRGSGRLEPDVRQFIQSRGLKSVEIIGRLNDEKLAALIRNARFLVWPSEGYYETFGMAAVECYARAVPVLASRIGVMTEMVLEGQTGLHFNPGDPEDLALKAQWFWDHPEEARRMGTIAREIYRKRFSQERAYEQLMEIYQKAGGNDHSI